MNLDEINIGSRIFLKDINVGKDKIMTYARFCFNYANEEYIRSGNITPTRLYTGDSLELTAKNGKLIVEKEGHTHTTLKVKEK